MMDEKENWVYDPEAMGKVADTDLPRISKRTSSAADVISEAQSMIMSSFKYYDEPIPTSGEDAPHGFPLRGRINHALNNFSDRISDTTTSIDDAAQEIKKKIEQQTDLDVQLSADFNNIGSRLN